MAKTTMHTCDMCKQSKSENDLSQMSITTRGIIMNTKNKYGGSISFDICSDCLKKKGFHIESLPEDSNDERTSKANQQTLSSKLCDILSDLGVQFYE